MTKQIKHNEVGYGVRPLPLVNGKSHDADEIGPQYDRGLSWAGVLLAAFVVGFVAVGVWKVWDGGGR